MRISYDETSHGLFIIFADRPSEDSEDVAPGIVVDYDKSGTPIAIELEDVRGLVDEAVLRRLTKPRIESGSDLREYRERLGLTQQTLGNLLGIPRNTIARWERD